MALSGEQIVLFGGDSGERLVSVASAQNVARQLPAATLWFWSATGQVHAVERGELLAHERAFEREFVPRTAAFAPDVPTALKRGPCTFVLAVHGGRGENGVLQAWLEAAGHAYTGSGPAASERAFDKVVAKNIVRAVGIKTAESVVLAQRAPQTARAALQELLGRFGRVVCKRVADGSSVGLFHVRSAADIDSVIESISAETDTAYLAEAFVAGREFTVGVIERPVAQSGSQSQVPLQPLPVSEVIMAAGRAFDYEGKYLGKGTTEVTPAELDDSLSAELQKIAARAHEALRCSGYSRTDIIVGERGPIYLETNTLPGLTQASFIPQQLQAAGLSSGGFLREQIQLAEQRWAAAHQNIA